MTVKITAGEKPMVFAFVLAAGTVMSSTGTPPFPPTHGEDRPGLSIEAVMYDYEIQAKALQTEMAALRKSDGGELTTEHRAYLRKRLVALVDAYNGEVRHIDPMSVNADGSRAR